MKSNRNTIARAAVVFASLGFLACGGDSTGQVTVNLAYPTAGQAETNTSSVHVWALEPLRDEVVCPDLVSKETEPFAARDFKRLADVVFNISVQPAPFVVEEVESASRILVYGEVTNFVGVTILAGCTEVQSFGEVTLTLVTPGTFDCTDPATVDGSICDDSQFCTQDNVCSAGGCSAGTARDCSFVEDDCNGSMCSEDLGCQVVASPTGTNCEDGNGCTSGDSCDGAGNCISGAIDCSAQSRGICVVGVCNTGATPDVCESVDSDDTLSTADDACTNNAKIAATDCYQLLAGDECNDATGRCNLAAVVPTPGTCSNQCRTDGTCSGILCTGGTPVATPPEASEVTCNDSIDNDCDDQIDCADTDCAASADCAL